MKSRLTALLLTLALLLTALSIPALAEEASDTRMPFYDVFPLQLDDNTVFELPVDWGYQFVELEGVPPIAYAMNDSEQLLMMVKIPADYTPNEASDRLGLTSFIPEGTAVMLGITTPQSTRLQEMTINDMPAVLVEMNGQGFDSSGLGIRATCTSSCSLTTTTRLCSRRWKWVSRCACSIGRTNGSIPRRISPTRRKTAK